MNWKAVIVGAIVFWLVTNIVGMFVTGIVIHQKILDPIYRANEPFWLPALAQDPPDMAAVMPRWLLNSFVSSLVVAGIYVCVHGSFQGSGARKGAMWGLCLAFVAASTYNAMGGLFNLPTKMWLWWGLDAFILYLIGGAAMGWAAQKFGGLEA